MLRIFDSLKSLISPELISKASAVLGEDTSKVSTAIPTTIASLLGALLQKGDSVPVKSVLEDAGKSNILTDMSGIFSDNISMKQKSIGNDFLSSVLGTKKNDFDNVIAATSGMTTSGAGKLTSMIAPIIAGFLGNKLVTNGYSLSGLLSQLNEEKHSFMGFIPNGVANIFGLSSVSDMVGGLKGKVTDTTKTIHEVPAKKSGSSWWMWLLMLVLLLLLFFWWRSCNKPQEVGYVDYQETVVAPADTVDVNPVNTDRERLSTQLTLPDSTKLSAYKGGIEEKMINFLNSNDYKNATADQLKDRWFEFDNITFAFGSATELTGNSQQQVNNIIDILKQYKNAKVLIGGNADKKGTDEANMAISRQRAKHIESLLDKGGVGSQVVRTEGFGDENAEHSASESDAQRAEDRDIMLRFVK